MVLSIRSALSSLFCCSRKEPSYEKISATFKIRFKIQNDQIFKRVWDQTIASHRVQWKQPGHISEEELTLLENAFQKSFIYHGKGIQSNQAGQDKHISEIVLYLLGQGGLKTEWINFKHTMGVLLKKDPLLLKAMRAELQALLTGLSHCMPVANTPEETLFKAFIGNIVALLPFSYPEEGETFLIPQRVGDSWKSIPYTVNKKIELTPRWFSSPIAAYGFTSSEGPPLLSFLGTTFPAGDGFLATLLSDVTPFLSVGHAPYLCGKKNIEAWLENKKNVQLYGASLGGAIALHVLRNHTSHIGQVHAYNAPGLNSGDWKKPFDEGPEINFYNQENDFVSSVGVLPAGKNVHVYHILPEQGENGFMAHARVYVGGKLVTLLKGDVSYENSRLWRKFLTLLHKTIGVLLISIPLLCLYLLYLLFFSLLPSLLAIF